MTRDEKIKRIEDIEKELAELKESIKKEDDRPWKPRYREKYYFITSDGSIFNTDWDDCMDKKAYAIGNVFRTEEDAKFTVEKLKVIHELKQFAEPKERAWDGKNDHYYITCTTFNSYENRINVYSSPLYKHHDIYFSSFNRAWKAIEAVGEDRIKKYYLEVE